MLLPPLIEEKKEAPLITEEKTRAGSTSTDSGVPLRENGDQGEILTTANSHVIYCDCEQKSEEEEGEEETA